MEPLAALTLEIVRYVQMPAHAAAHPREWVLVPGDGRRRSLPAMVEWLAVAPKPLVVGPLAAPGEIAVWPVGSLDEASRSLLEHERRNQLGYFSGKLAALGAGDEDEVHFASAAGRVTLPVASLREWLASYTLTSCGITVKRAAATGTLRLAVLRADELPGWPQDGGGRMTPTLESLVAALPTAAALYGADGALLHANAGFRILSGATPGDAPPLAQGLPGSDADLAAALAGIAKGRVEIVRSAEFRRDDVVRRVDLTFSPVAGDAVLVIASDPADRRLVPDRRRDRAEPAAASDAVAAGDDPRRAPRLAALGELTADVLHDVNNALSPIMTAAYLLEAKAEDAEAVREYARRIAASAERGAASAARVGRLLRDDVPAAAGDGPAQPPTDAPAGEARRVLVVEDHADGREMLRTVLEHDGHRVTTATTLVEAMDALQGAGPFDVVVTDLGLPDGSGEELVALARHRWPGVRVGIVTGWEPAELPACADCDFTLRKPIHPAELLARVRG